MDYDRSETGFGKIYLRGFSSNGTEIIRTIADYDSNSTINIWTFLGIQSNNTNNFKVPVTLFNKIENTNTSFGYLNANGNQVRSGNEEPFKFNVNQTVTHGTLDTNFANKRHYSFEWANSDFIIPPINQNFYNGNFNFTTVIDQQFKSITRNFRPVYPLTIKNSLDEAGNITTDNIYFKDPIDDNTYHSYFAGTGGFIKNEAFYNLDEKINGIEHQKYGAKAVSNISYNGRTYQYSGGDFSTGGTDFILSAPATKTAHYKGIQLSSQTNANAGSGQRKFVKTSDGYLHQVYESLNKIWYEKSTDNGTTWEIMNGGAPVSGNAKQPSIDFYNTATDKVVVIVYEAYSSSSVNLMAAIYKDGVSQQSYGLALYTGMTQEDVDALNCRSVVSISSDGKILIV